MKFPKSTSAALRPLLRALFPLLATAAAVLLAPPPSAGAQELLAPHAAVGDTLTADEARRFGVLDEVAGLRRAVFVAAPWGGYLARMTVERDGEVVLRERNVPADVWRDWGARIEAVLAGGAEPAPPVAAAPADTTDVEAAIAAAGDTAAVDTAAVAAAAVPVDEAPPAPAPVWPESPLPRAVPEPRIPETDLPPPPFAGRWILSLDLGYKHNTTDFADYFTDMIMGAVAVGRPLSDHVVPWLGFQAAAGDIPDDFETLSGDGRSTLYAVEAGVRLRAGLGRRTRAYLGGGGGYYMRALRWGGQVFLGYDGYYETGTAVRELQDWGYTVRLGLEWDLKPQGAKLRLLDVGLRYEGLPGEDVLFEDSVNGVRITGGDRDGWLGLHVGLVMGL